MHDIFRFGSIEEGLAFIAVQLAILSIALVYEYRWKQLEKKQLDLESLIFDIEMYAKHRHKRLGARLRDY
ncbi:MAG: hypothetical protein APF77_21025 [Clostridia bacterium BRH_c25]|nr:MAG: hypothetical protein APF77_21025 [Clostridia bacterium BRH_c25]